MRKLLSAVALLTGSSLAWGNQIFYDGFSYPVGSGLGTNLPWIDAVVRTPPIEVMSGSLNYAGLPSSGNSVQLNNVVADTNIVTLGDPITSGTLYFSMIVQLNSAVAGANQAYFAGFDDHNATSGTFSTGAALVIKTSADPTQIDLGIAPPGNNNAYKKYSTTPYSTSDILFVVGSYQFNSGTTTDDVQNLFVFANGAAIPSVEPSTPTATAMVGGAAVDLTKITRFFLRNNTGESPTILADEVRVGTSWTNILPLAGDTNFDGQIGADDYALIDRGYAKYQAGAIAAGTAVWTDGDLNQDHIVDASDYMILDQALLNQGGSLSPGLLAEREAAFGAGYVSALAVPEPASVGLIGLAGLMAIRRRAK